MIEESNFVRTLRARVTSFRTTFYFLTRSQIATVGLIIVIVYILLAIFGPIVVGGNPYVMRQYTNYIPGIGYIFNNPQPPSARFPLGTTFEGYDIYNGIMKGARLDLGVAAIVVLSGASIGTILGSVAGYKGGIIGDVIMRITDIFLSIPYIVLAVAFLLIFGRTLQSLVESLILVWWPFYARLVRGQVLSVRELKYVEASVAAGASSLRTLLRHIIPNSIYPIFVQISLDFGGVILTIASLDFLGFGFAGPNLAEWGNILGLATKGASGILAIVDYPWTIAIPGVVILVLVLGLNLLGDGLRDATDPRLRR
ncbi:MAG: ABC transporter permease [Nitrososphaeria archaeon]